MVKINYLVPFFAYFIVKVYALYEQANNDICETPNGSIGECVPIRECPKIFNITIQNRPLSQKTIDNLKIRHCRFHEMDPKVCCELKELLTVKTSPLLPNTRLCGIASDQRILGGETVGLDEFPWLALINYQKPTGNGFHCEGVLISKRYVLTAAHCIKGKHIPRDWQVVGVRLGEYDVTTETDCVLQLWGQDCAEAYKDVKVVEKIVHEEYDPNDRNQRNDIALLALENDVNFTEFIRPICLPTSPDILNEQNITVVGAGWGTNREGVQNNMKKQFSLTAISNNICSETYGTHGASLGKNQLCASEESNCRGQSSRSSLMRLHYANNQFKWYAVGIASFESFSCRDRGRPGVYTRVYEYMPWIISKLKD